MPDNSIGALWLKEKNGKKYMSGKITINGQEHSIVVFKNDYAKTEKHPAYKIYPSQPRGESRPEEGDLEPW